jgi:hypothetical protein
VERKKKEQRMQIFGQELRLGGRGGSIALTLVASIMSFVPAETANAQSWFDNFDEYTLGSFPSAWQPSGNTQTSVVDSEYVDPDQSVQTYGVVGGCWGALMFRELQVSPPFTIQFYAMNGDETLSGCHPLRATVELNTSPSWTTSQRMLAEFGPTGDFLTPPLFNKGPGYPLLTWVNVQITYELTDANHVKMSYYLNGKLEKTVTTTQYSYEGQLAWLGLQAAEGTAWFDDVSVVSGTPPVTVTALTSTPNPSTKGESVKFTAEVSSANGTPPDGEAVNFLQGNDVLGTAVLTGGIATFTTDILKVGTDSISAVYGGDADFGVSRSNTVKQEVEKD